MHGRIPEGRSPGGVVCSKDGAWVAVSLPMLATAFLMHISCLLHPASCLQADLLEEATGRLNSALQLACMHHYLNISLSKALTQHASVSGQVG